jgi:hypothetical protein
MPTELMNPCGLYARLEKPLAKRRPLGEIRTVGLFSNLKHNADLFLDNVERLMRAKYKNLEFIRFQKIASVPANFTNEFLTRCHAVVAAFGD